MSKRRREELMLFVPFHVEDFGDIECAVCGSRYLAPRAQVWLICGHAIEADCAARIFNRPETDLLQCTKDNGTGIEADAEQVTERFEAEVAEHFPW